MKGGDFVITSLDLNGFFTYPLSCRNILDGIFNLPSSFKGFMSSIVCNSTIFFFFNLCARALCDLRITDFLGSASADRGRNILHIGSQSSLKAFDCDSVRAIAVVNGEILGSTGDDPERTEARLRPPDGAVWPQNILQEGTWAP